MLNKLPNYVFIFFCLATAACKTTLPVTTKPVATSGNYFVNGKLFAGVYQQTAGEYRALCYQAYNIAALRISEYKANGNKPPAIITDIDETILDNSPYAIRQGLQNKDFVQQDWYNWTSLANADTMPGAGAFLRSVQAKGIEVYYITNRDGNERLSTLKNLQKFNLPNADEAHLITKAGTSSKEVRRQSVAATHDIILLMGDNLADFSVVFDKQSTAARNARVDDMAAMFGNRFIVFPNTGYGDWEGSFLNYNYKLTPAQKDSVLRSQLKGF